MRPHRASRRSRALDPVEVASAALRDLVDAGILIEHGTIQANGRGRRSRLYTSPELLGLTASSPVGAGSGSCPATAAGPADPAG